MLNKKFLGLITRCKDEYFVKEFVDYYISQGVDHIYIIDDSVDKSIYNNINSKKVTIKYEKNIIKNKIARKFYRDIRNKFVWMINVDVDEFIVTSKRVDKTIRNELKTTFKNVDLIKIPWVMMSCNNRKKNPKSLLLENIYRWNHDKKHPNKIHKFRCRYNEIEVKSIFKSNKFKKIVDHMPKNPTSDNIIIVDSINKKKQKNNRFYENLREHDIKNGILLCYHYRIISRENCINKLKNNIWYIKNKYVLNDLMNADHSEVKDSILRYKVINYKLKFVHITKTSGTYIENLALKKNIFWGINDKLLKNMTLPEKCNKTYWHLPLKIFNSNPYNKINCKLFTIVRNPYDRIISECLCKWGGRFATKMETVDDLNRYIEQQVKTAGNLNFHNFMPQHLYTHDTKHNKIIDYIIKYEEIDKFNDLMDKYFIDIKYIFKDSYRKFNINNISVNNIKLINKVYDLDFKLLGYNKII